MVYSGFASYGRGRSSTPTSVLVIRFRGPGSAIVESISPGRQIGSVNIASYCSFFLCKAQVCYYLPLLCYIVLMDYIRALYLNALRNIIYGSSDYWSRLLSANWLWSCLSLSRLIGIEVPDGVKSWFSSWHIGETKPCSLMFWELVRPVDGLVLSHFGPSRIATFASISFTILASILLSRLLLSYLNCMSTTTLFEWLNRLLCSLLLKQLSGTTKMHSISWGHYCWGF